MSPGQIKCKVHPEIGLLRPKKRCKAAQGGVTAAAQMQLEIIHPFHRMPRMKKSGRPHQQIWLRPSTENSATPLKLPTGPSLDEMISGVTQASLSAAHFSFLRRYDDRVVQRFKAKAREIFYTYQPLVLPRLKRVAISAVTLLAMTATLRAQYSAKSWL
jgi:hypothetical protein